MALGVSSESSVVRQSGNDVAPIKVCFFRRAANCIFDAGSPYKPGGAEVRSRYFAEGLAARTGFDVQYLVGNEGQPRIQRFGNLSVVREPFWTTDLGYVAYSRFRRAGGLRSERFPGFSVAKWNLGLFWQLPILAWNEISLAAYHRFRAAGGSRSDRFPGFSIDRPNLGMVWQLPTIATSAILARCNYAGALLKRYIQNHPAHVISCFGTEGGVADVIAACKRSGKRSILFLKHDWEADLAIVGTDSFVAPLGEFGHRIRFAIEHADAVVVQTLWQQQILEQNFKKVGILVRNPIRLDLPLPSLPHSEREFVLWIGRTEAAHTAHKRPRLLLELAKQLPNVRFVAILNPANQIEFDAIKAEAPANLSIVDHVDRSEMDAYFRKARLFVSTASREGFPNAFLEAFKHSVPVASLNVDPDGVIERFGLGANFNDDMQRLRDYVQYLWSSPQLAEKIGERARKYVEDEHEFEARIDQIENLIRGLVHGNE